MDDIDAIVAGLSEAARTSIISLLWVDAPCDLWALEPVNSKLLGGYWALPNAKGAAVLARLKAQSPTIAIPASTQA